MKNPHDYDDDGFTRYSSEVDSAVGGLWESGASLTDLESLLQDALENATTGRLDVSISE